MTKSIFTCGDINGIGPEIVIKTLNKFPPNRNRKIIFICPRNIFEESISLVKPKFDYTISKSFTDSWEKDKLFVLDIGRVKKSIGKATISSGKTSYKAILKACEIAGTNFEYSIITAPISKTAFVKAKINFPGHTELFADYFNSKNFAMMFVSNKMKAALATIHIPLKMVANSINITMLREKFDIIIESLKNDFNIKYPKIGLLGLNPHAGEEGNIGIEEEKIIKPALNKFSHHVFGPFVPDAYFGNQTYKKYDCTIGIYHDQVLIPFKLMNFNNGVNFTAGLPIARTSPDHGTAFDIAWKGIADSGSMIEAFKYAQFIQKNRRIHR